MGSWQSAADCEALFRQHQGYLSLDKKYHLEVAWLAMVQDSFNAAPLKASSSRSMHTVIKTLAVCTRL